MSHTYNIYIARSNLVSPSSPDVHHMGQVQVRMKVHVLSGFILSIIHLPSFFLRQRAWMPLMSFFLSSGVVKSCFQPLFQGLWGDGRVRE